VKQQQTGSGLQHERSRVERGIENTVIGRRTHRTIFYKPTYFSLLVGSGFGFDWKEGTAKE
jgi:hypothetical protein